MFHVIAEEALIPLRKDGFSTLVSGLKAWSGVAWQLSLP